MSDLCPIARMWHVARGAISSGASSKIRKTRRPRLLRKITGRSTAATARSHRAGSPRQHSPAMDANTILVVAPAFMNFTTRKSNLGPPQAWLANVCDAQRRAIAVHFLTMITDVHLPLRRHRIGHHRGRGYRRQTAVGRAPGVVVAAPHSPPLGRASADGCCAGTTFHA